jgi:hypothetical protein
MRRLPVRLSACVVAALAASLATAVATANHASAAELSGLGLARQQLPALQKDGPATAEAATHAIASQSPPSGAISPNLEFLSNLPLPSAISIAFIGNTAFVSTVVGVYSVDITDPTNPQLLGALPMYIWENEHMQADPARNLLIIARDPRGFTTPATTAFPYGALHILDVSNPRAMVELSLHTTPTGHTATCINNCTYLWVAGPASPAVAVANGADPTWGGRPMWGVNITDPSNPVDCPHFIDLNNHDGTTDYDHDVDVDANGVAWVSGSGHIRGYWTQGQHVNPVDGKVETATACDPIPYGGGDVSEGQLLVQGGVMHNSGHNLNIAVDGRKGDVIAATEEVTVTNCATSGRFLTYDVGASYQGQAWANGGKTPFTLTKLDQWTPQNQVGSSGCDSAHWFTDNGSGLIAIAFYTQGTRLLDIRDPRHIQQVGYYNVQNTDTWSAFWHGDNYIFIADFERGLDILRYHPNGAAPAVSVPESPAVAMLGLGGLAVAAGTVAVRRQRRRRAGVT